jgi:hypothetical protein
MKPKLNYRSTICLISMAIFSLILLNVVSAQDQSPPSGMDKGVWVLKEKKPDFGTAEDTDAYFNNKVDPSEYNVKGSLSWGDQTCSGSEWGTSSWSEISSILYPGVGQNTTLKAEVGGSQNCAYRHVSARTALYINGAKPGPEASISYPTSDPKPDPVSVKVPWEAPWGKIGDTLTVTIVAQVPAAIAMHCSFDYIYSYEASGSQPKQSISVTQSAPIEQKKPAQNPEILAQPYCPCGGGDSGVRFSDLSGQVDLRPDCRENAWKAAEIATIPCVDDHVRTGEDSTAIMSFADMSVFIMKPESEIILDTAPQKDAKVKLVSGRIWENVKKMITEGQMEVEMSQAVMGIKGTTIVCEEAGSSSTLKVLEGTASFRSKTTGEEILVSAGKMATATENGLSKPQPFDVDAENASWGKIAHKPRSPDAGTVTSKEIFNNWNVGGVDNSPSYAPSFTLSEPYMITYIDTYHWNYGSGTEAGGTIKLIDNYGNEYGPWTVETKSGQGGVPNAWWIAHPNEVIPAGEYTVLDSDESTWSQNQESGGYGFSKVEGYPA